MAGAAALLAQPYDLVLRGGHVIDPANHIDAVSDVAIAQGRIAAVQSAIPESQARRVIDVSGLYVLPGLVDMHAHVFGSSEALFPDDTSLPKGSTTVVDAGGSGWRTIDEFRRTVMTHSKTRVLALMNIVGHGMVGEPYESDTTDMDPEKTAAAIERNREVVVGIKTAHFGGTGWTAIDRAVAAGRLANVPVMVDDRIFTNTGRTTRDELLDHLRPGDIHTHMYNDRQMELLNRVSGKVQPYMLEARRRGVLFDLGHGAGSFLWPVASRAMAQGFWPDTISTDLHTDSILADQPDMPNCMSKMLLLGMPLDEIVLRSTVSPAKEIHRFPELGTLSHGATADVAVLSLNHGVFAFKDAWGMKRLGTQRLECVMTVRAGEIAFDRDGRQSPDWKGAPSENTSEPAQIYDLLLKNGHLIDPANHRNGTFDVAIVKGKIAAVGHNLPASHARIVIEASQYYVTPGLIDLGTHFANLQPDHNCLPYGVTTAVDTDNAHANQKALQPGMARMKTRLVGVVPPDSSAPVIATGISRDNVLAPTNMMAAMSKLLNEGTGIEQVIERATVNAARAIHRPELGSLADGAPADLALLQLREGTPKRIRCVLTLRDGAVVWDTEALSRPDWVQAGPYSNFK